MANTYHIFLCVSIPQIKKSGKNFPEFPDRGESPGPEGGRGRLFRRSAYAYWYCFLYFLKKRSVMTVASSSENTTEYHTP